MCMYWNDSQYMYMYNCYIVLGACLLFFKILIFLRDSKMRATLLELVHVQPNMLFLELHLKTIFFSPGSYMFSFVSG